MKSYDRQEGETAKAYAAFCVYRNMGVKRSLDRAAADFYAPQTPHKHPKNTTSFERWSTQWDWMERCKDFDRDREMLLREEQRRKDIKDHDQKLEHFRLQNEAVGTGLLTLSAQLLTTVAQMTAPLRARIEAGESPTPEDWAIIFSLPSSIKAIAGFAHLGSQLAADGLLVRQLIEQLKESEGG